jgi:hypothetical protein
VIFHWWIRCKDRVLLKKVGFKGKHKLENKWERDPYIIEFQPDTDIPVYVLTPGHGRSRKVTVHRNMLLPWRPKFGGHRIKVNPWWFMGTMFIRTCIYLIIVITGDTYVIWLIHMTLTKF